MFGSTSCIWDADTQQTLRHLAGKPVIMAWGFSSGHRRTRCGQESSSLFSWSPHSYPWVSTDFLSVTYELWVPWKRAKNNLFLWRIRMVRRWKLTVYIQNTMKPVSSWRETTAANMLTRIKNQWRLNQRISLWRWSKNTRNFLKFK